jgi:hypothetical protein
VNHALVFVLISIAGGLAALFALQPVAPALGPAVALGITAAALIGGALIKDRQGEGERQEPPSSTAPVTHSTLPGL